MSAETVKLLNTHLNEILKMPEVATKMATFGALPAGGDANRLEKTNAADYDRFGKLIKDLGIQAE
jgi:tripartite-type tricarboxylate transporter receptor subunit TctC